MVWEGPDAIAGIDCTMLLLAVQHNMRRAAYVNDVTQYITVAYIALMS
jgi:hypothetical protein